MKQEYIDHEPHSVEEAKKHIENIYISGVFDEPGCYYYQAILELLREQEPKSFRSAIFWSVVFTFNAGIQHGKRIIRRQNRERKAAQANTAQKPAIT